MRITHKIYNLTLTNANQEYSQELSPLIKFISVKSRNPISDLRFSFTEGETDDDGPYKTIFAPSEWYSGELASQPNGRTLYVRGTEAGTVVEIETWT